MDSYAPSRIRADLLQIAFDAGARPLRDGDPASGLDVIGYSLGSRLAWEFGATQPDLVHRLVLGGPTSPIRLLTSIWLPRSVTWPTAPRSPTLPPRAC